MIQSLISQGKSISLIMEENNDFGENPQQGQGQQSGMKCGWLRKQGGFVKTWHTRWFVLKGDQLYYFKDEEETKPLGTIFLPGNKVLEHPCNEDSPGKFFFEVVPAVLGYYQALVLLLDLLVLFSIILPSFVVVDFSEKKKRKQANNNRNKNF
ncbi:rho GTPase-activating protein 24-like isoform X3 [Trichechus manatus latirostris]|uniref:Rho GTPase-activating protein 24-like isoform X3 n=1 Tax=Trichechus manatus latirostris TaxID=127582 RepID=A0A2Y9QMQ7_TRIMA|nr:rho GTPase-activating protein 24-like isoform X3 [Trichechus manatus latirostris]